MKSTKWVVALGLGLMAVVSCGETPADREETVVKMKILAVRVDEPDVHPGQMTRVHVLVASPSPTSFTTFITPFSQSAAADYGSGKARFGNSGIAFNFFPGSTQPTLPVDLGIPLATKAAPNFGTAFYKAPATIGTYELAVFAREGAPALGEFLRSPELAQAKLQAELGSALKGFKTVRVRPEGDVLNKNPVVTRMTVEKHWAKPKKNETKHKPLPITGFTMLPEQIIRVKTQIEDENVDRASTVWWLTDGRVEGYGRQDIDYIAPKRNAIVTLIGLVLDREGGENWYFQDIAVGVNNLSPDVTDFMAKAAYLALSAGRMLWIGFPEAASAAAAVNLLNQQTPVIVSGTLTANPAARLGWYLSKPVFVDAAKDVTAPVISAADIYAPPTAPTSVFLRLDGLITGRSRALDGNAWTAASETLPVVLHPAN